MDLACVLWDFGGTLVDERWMQQAPHGIPAWSQVWSEIAAGELADRWNLGEVSLADVVDAVAARLPMTSDAVLDHVRLCCANVSFFDTPLQIARASSLPQAIVTINPDGFSELVVRNYRLGDVFRPIVTSWEEHTLDKGALGLIALERIGGGLRPSDTLLVDNKSENIETWARLGGRGYLFRGEKQFLSDLRSELLDLAVSAGWAAA